MDGNTVADRYPSEERVRTMLHYSPESGSFRRIGRGRGISLASPVGTRKSDGRLEICIFGHRHYAHRLAWLLVHGVWPSGVIDHINGDPSDNRICNLRDVTTRTNIQNQRHAQRSNQSCGLLGVTFNKQRQRWAARIQLPIGRSKHLGYFTTDAEAHLAYLAAKRLHHEGCVI